MIAKKGTILLFVALLAGFSNTQGQQKKKKAVPIILDTDIGPDYDDVGAVAVLHALTDNGEAKPLAIMASNANENVAPSIDILNTYFGRPQLTIGAPKGPKAPNEKAQQKWPQLLMARYPHTIKNTAEVPDAVKLYRKILASQPNKSVTIVTVGFLTNMEGLLESQPDEYSKLDGKALIEKKVKELVSMAGKFPEGREFNLFIDSLASAKVFLQWPTPIIYSGFEIGQKVVTGLELINNKSIEDSPVQDAYAEAMSFWPGDDKGRMSWDQTAVLVAVRGASPYYTLKKGEIIIEGGYNRWKDDPNGRQAYLVEAVPAETVRKEIEKLMMHVPKRK